MEEIITITFARGCHGGYTRNNNVLQSAPMAQLAKSTYANEIEGGPLSNRCYYAGINSSWSLVATTARNDRVRQNDPMEPFSLKRISCVGTHAIVKLWDTLAHTITPLNTENAWRLLSCYRIGRASNTDATNPVVLLVHVKTGMLGATDGLSLATQILQEYHKLLDKLPNSDIPLPRELTVEIAEILPCNSNTYDGILSDGPPYSQNTQPGSSIGYRGSLSSGSIAAFFEATLISGKPTKVLLTNHHVASPDSDKPFPPRWGSEGSPDMLSPSPQDLKATYDHTVHAINVFTNRVKREKERIQKYETSCDTSLLALEAQRKSAKQLEEYQAVLTSLQMALPTLVEDNTMWDMASLAQTSGWRSDQRGNQMDWGVATLTKDLPSPNKLPQWEFSKGQKHLELVVLKNFDPLPSSLTTLSLVPLQAGEMVIKHGRTTGWTFGTVNECAAYHFNWQADGEKSKAISIVGYNGFPFCEKGDSGSMVLNTKGEAAAILFTAHTPDTIGGLAFAADIGTTMADIQLRTPLRGMKLLG